MEFFLIFTKFPVYTEWVADLAPGVNIFHELLSTQKAVWYKTRQIVWYANYNSIKGGGYLIAQSR